VTPAKPGKLDRCENPRLSDARRKSKSQSCSGNCVLAPGSVGLRPTRRDSNYVCTTSASVASVQRVRRRPAHPARSRATCSVQGKTEAAKRGFLESVAGFPGLSAKQRTCLDLIAERVLRRENAA
jgi:hypothetical protein